MTTGLNLAEQLYVKVNQPYTGYFDAVKLNRIFQESLYKVALDTIKQCSTQKDYDELTWANTTQQEFALVNGMIAITDIPDYLYSKEIKVRTFNKIANIADVEGGIVELANYQNFTLGQQIYVKDVNPPAQSMDGYWYCFPTSPKKLKLFSDEEMTVPLNVTNYINGGKVGVRIYQDSQMITSDEKVSIFSKLNDPLHPLYEFAEQNIKCYPTDSDGVLMDYYKKPTVMILTTNNTIDLEVTYNLPFLYTVLDYAARLFSMDTKDVQGMQMYDKEIIDNE